MNLGKYIGRHLFAFLAAVTGILILNLLIFAFLFRSVLFEGQKESTPGIVLEQTSAGFRQEKDGSWYLEKKEASRLQSLDVWALLLNEEGDAIWSQDLPPDLPQSYSLQDIAAISHGYLRDYPVFLWNTGENLLMLGYPVGSYMKILSNYLPMAGLSDIPGYLMTVLGLDLILLFLAYFISKRRILKHTDPILQAVDELSRGKPVSVKIPGELKPIGERLNRTSEILKNKNQARANWIQGISHDIRTPLSMIMGYADQISTEIRVPEDQKKKARIIRSQSVRIRELIKDLNLVSQLEYEMQPVMLQPVKIASLLREVAAEYLNEGLEEKYRLCPELPADTALIEVQGDKRLLKRAVRNLVSNSINHNPQGCQITIRLETEDRHCKVVIQDDGTGLSEQELNDLRKRPHYLSSTDERLDLRHGIGLHLVRQIMDIHKARMVITSEAGNGVQTALLFQTLS